MTGGADASPYIGDRPFTGADTASFHGRTAEAAEVAALWRRNRITAVFGGSGVGLTSLLRAGVAPRAAGRAGEVLPVGRISLGSAFPLAALPESNPHTLALLASWSPNESLTSLVRFTIADFLRRRWRDIRPADAQGHRPVLLCAIDQAEELVTGQVAGGRFGESFMAEITQALAAIPEMRLLLCVRRDYRGELAARFSEAGCPIDVQFELRPLSPAAAVEAVRGPLEGTGRSYAAGVAEGLVARLTDRGDGEAREVAPALLQTVCSRLWRVLPPDVREITELDVRRAGGVRKLVADFCDQAVATVSGDQALPAEELLAWLQEWFVTELGRRALVDEGPDGVKGVPSVVVRALRDWHVLSAEMRAGSRWYELLHDVLIEPIRQAGARQRVRELVSPLVLVRSPAEYLAAAKAAMAGGDLTLAGRHATSALRDGGDQDLRLSAAAESVLGNVAYGQGDLAEAGDRYRRAAALAETVRDTPLVAYCLAAIGRTLILRGRRSEAVESLYGAVARVPGDATMQSELARALEFTELTG